MEIQHSLRFAKMAEKKKDDHFRNFSSFFLICFPAFFLIFKNEKQGLELNLELCVLLKWVRKTKRLRVCVSVGQSPLFVPFSTSSFFSCFP